ncbi:DUF1064 domain-containing protein [Acinetobacter bereziniae]|uniref:DUF1064 domain-containing protein n=1 Tax=Acinetobacter bereziniae TaxID=106648 RepID=UPI0021E3EAA1|nr:DUF1064 domain-containing protein [Acinetobacter bereziniae]MCV2444767.1 DUF1064 domain-containing protein [Acinetobacter bereziniae]
MQIPKGWQTQSKPVARSRQSKYKNKTIECDGLKFDSVKEARRYRELKILERTGEIRELQTQYAFVLAESVRFSNEPRKKPALRYIADFVYLKDGCQIVEDVKSKISRSLAEYRIKKHLMMSVHGIEILEV